MYTETTVTSSISNLNLPLLRGGEKRKVNTVQEEDVVKRGQIMNENIKEVGDKKGRK